MRPAPRRLRGTGGTDRSAGPVRQTGPVELLPVDLPVSAGVRTVLLSRHGRTTANELHVNQSWDEWGLSESGLADAVRARALDARWAEIASPPVAGMTTAQVHRHVPHLYRADGWPVRHADGGEQVETTDVLLERVGQGLRRAAASVPVGATVAVFSHGACVAYLAQAGGLATETVPNLGVLELQVDPAQGWRRVGLHHPLAHG